MSDRLKLPSASGFSRLVACPGSFALEQTVPEGESTEAADRGTRIHSAFCSGDTSKLTDGEREDYDQGLRHLELLKARWIEDLRVRDVEEKPREARYWLHSESFELLGSGQPDRLFIGWSEREDCWCAFSPDVKSGWQSSRVPASPRNYQLLFYACLIREEFGIENIRVSIIRAKSKADPSDFCDFTPEDLRMALQSVQYHIWESRMPDAPRKPGEHCDFCRAKGVCVEAGSYSMLPSAMAIRANPNGALTKDTIEAMVARLSLPDRKFIWQRSRIIRAILVANDDSLKAESEETLKQVGLEIAEHGKRLDPIVNPHGAFDLLTTVHTFNPDDLWRTLKMEKGSLAELIMRERNLNEKQAKAWLAEVLAGFIEKKESERPLKEIKE